MLARSIARVAAPRMSAAAPVSRILRRGLADEAPAAAAPAGAMTFSFTVPSESIYDSAPVEMVILPGGDGQFGVMPNHVPTIAELERFTAPSARRCVDLGCGKGRDAIWLASRGWHVTGVDNQQCFLRALELFAARQGLSHLISCVQLDVVKQRQQKRVVQEAGDIGAGEESMERLLRKLFAPPLALVNVARFMHRGLLDDCVCFMPRGCVLGVHHFLEGAVSLKSGREIKAHDANMCSLARGELSARYADSLPHVLLCDEETLEEGIERIELALRSLNDTGGG